jgi:hypothetical protein
MVQGLSGGGDAARLGGAAGSWALVSGLAAAGLGRLVIPAPRYEARSVVLALAGSTAAASLSSWARVAWTEQRFGRWDPDFTPTTLLVTLCLVLIGVAACGWLTTRRPARQVAFGLGFTSVALVLLETISNVRGISNGLSDAAWLLGFGIGVAAVYGAASAIAWWRRSRVSAASD